jgi:hypothetical protein
MRIGDNLKVEIVRKTEEIEKVRSIWERMQADEPYPKINADIDGYLTAIKATGDSPEPYIMVVKENERPAAMLISWVRKSPLKCAVGRKTLFSPVLRQLSVVYGGVIGDRTDEICSLLIGELIKVLRRGEVDVVFFNHLETDSCLYHVAREMPGVLSRCYLPRIETHWRTTVPENIRFFYQRLPRRHASNLRRISRTLERAYPNRVGVTTYRDESELDAALKAASKISSSTYQYAYGLGVVDDRKTRTLLSEAARLGRLQIDILHINGEPSAFQLATRYGNTYFGDKIGFNPKWKKFRIGTVLFLKVMETLCADPSVAYYDFGYGDAEYKESYGDTGWAESSVYIFAPRAFPVFANLIFSTTSAINILAQHLIIRLGILNLVQRYRRRFVLKRIEKEKENLLPV